MILRSSWEEFHAKHLRWILKRGRTYNMKFNKEKCTFGVRADKFLGFYLTKRGIKANPDKCETVICINSPTSKKEVQKLNGMLSVLNRFILRSSQNTLLFYMLLRKKADLGWTLGCTETFKTLKKTLLMTPLLTATSQETFVLICSSRGRISARHPYQRFGILPKPKIFCIRY